MFPAGQEEGKGGREKEPGRDRYGLGEETDL